MHLVLVRPRAHRNQGISVVLRKSFKTGNAKANFTREGVAEMRKTYYIVGHVDVAQKVRA